MRHCLFNHNFESANQLFLILVYCTCESKPTLHICVASEPEAKDKEE